MSTYIDPLLENLRQRISSDSLLAQFDLLSLARPSVRISARRVPSALIELGDSRIGGVPDVPTGFEWPRWAPKRQRPGMFAKPSDPNSPQPMAFIAQVNLGELPRIDESMPDSGWLYFFYDRYHEPSGFDPDDRGGCRVIYVNCERSALSRISAPEDADPDHLAELCLVEAWPELTLPDEVMGLEYGDRAFDAYRAVVEELNTGGDLQNRLLGHPQPIQSSMELQCQLASNGVYCGGTRFESEKAKLLEAGAGDWRLLMQIDTDDNGPGWMWGDVGRVYFWIKQQDLAAQNFSGVWLILQCC